jgi:hypothetical protein
MSRLYSNENFPLPAVAELRNLGHDVLTGLESGRAGQRIPDNEVLKFSIMEQRILLTMNRKHFIRLHNSDSDHFGIIVCTFDPDFVSLARRIDEAIKATGDTKAKLIRVNRPAQ